MEKRQSQGVMKCLDHAIFTQVGKDRQNEDIVHIVPKMKDT